MQSVTVITAAILMLSAWPLAAPAAEQDEARALTRSGAIVPLEDVTSQVRKRGIREILEVELESEHGGYRYEVEVVDDAGVVRKLLYDAATGQPLGEIEDD